MFALVKTSIAFRKKTLYNYRKKERDFMGMATKVKMLLAARDMTIVMTFLKKYTLMTVFAIVMVLIFLMTACNKSNDGGKGVTQTDMLFNMKTEYIGDVSTDVSITNTTT